MNTNFEPVMSALLAWWQSTVSLPFTASSTPNSAVLTGVSNFNGLFAGLPIVGPAVVRGATIQSLNPAAGQVTLSDPVSAGGPSESFTAGFQTVGRRLQHWTQVDDQPALFLRRIGAVDEYHGDFFPVTTLECEAWIYCNAGQDPDVAPDMGLTSLEQLVRQSFTPDTDYGDPRFTLGGLAYWCRVEGRTDSSAGDQGVQAISRIPIRITLP